MITTRPLVLVAFVVLVAALPASAATDSRAAGAASARSDFNGDGFADLAIGVPYEDVGSVIDAGAVNVVYGSATGLKVAGNSFWHQDSTGVTGVSETGDHFGAAIVAGDFDGDGITDLAIGIPDESTGTVADEGGVQLLRGTRTGLVAWRYWNILNATGGTTDELCNCRFGAALAAGDFNDDGKTDLAIGGPNESGQSITLQPVEAVGSVTVLYGSDAGLSALGFKRIPGGGVRAYRGASLAAADHDGDGRDDLAVGAPGSDQVSVYFGSPAGLRTDTGVSYHDWDEFRDPDSSQFGRSLAMGDVNGDGKHELFVGAPLDGVGDVLDAGAVFEYHSGGLTRQYTQRSLPGVAAEQGDRFGWALAVGDFDRNGRADLAIGTPNEDTTAGSDAGIVTVLSSYGTGVLDTQSAKTWSQASTGVPGAAEAGDRFGAALAACNLGNGLAADLAIGVPLEDFTAGGLTRSNAGVVDVLYGSTSGLTATGVQDWSQATTSMLGGFEPDDQFGYVLAC